MTTPPPVSVIIVSRGRPALLHRCLIGVGQLWYPDFEIVVVSDPEGLDAVAPWGDAIKRVAFDAANIASARNAGIRAAAGSIVAFIDDDAVPEPTWLTYLVAPFSDPEVAQTGGYVRGRNGISFQWRARAVNRLGAARDIPQSGDAPFTPELAQGEAIKTEGTNMALRRSVIADIGGFDPAFHYFLDETDVNLRLADRCTMIVPTAQVHHAFAASDNRTEDRVPTDLTEIGASWAVFLRKHAPDEMETATDRAFSEQEQRLRRHLDAGRMTAAEKTRLEESFFRGFDVGLTRDAHPSDALPDPNTPFKRFEHTFDGTSVLIAGRAWSKRRLAAKARAAVADGSVATVLRLSPTARPHRMRFHAEGYWEQRGGLFGPSDRAQPRVRLWSFSKRVAAERTRIGILREKQANIPEIG